MDKSASKMFYKASNKFSELSTKKTFLYVVTALSAFSMIGYLATNQIKPAIFFVLVALVASQFSTNMAIILLIAMLTTNFFASMRAFKGSVREGMEDGSDEVEATDDANKDVEDKMTSEQKQALKAVKTSKTMKDAKKKVAKADAVKIAKETKAEANTDAEAEPEAMSSMTKTQNNTKGGSSRIDYASTLENAYSDLSASLGSGGIKELTKDTSKLMAQQKELFESMQAMAPLIQDAKDMMQGFDMKSLGDLATLATNVNGPKE